MDRRSAPRFCVATPWEGALRVIRDVVVLPGGGDDLVVVSPAAGVVGEDMHLEVVGGGDAVNLSVTVLDSRPVMLDGALRHRLHLRTSSEDLSRRAQGVQP